MAVLTLRTEHDDIRVCLDLDVVPRWPVEQVTCVDGFLHSACVGGGELAAQDEAPMGTLAQIAFQSLEQWGGIYPRRETEILTADLA